MPSGDGWDPLELWKNKEIDALLTGHYWNSESKKSFADGQITIGFVRLNENDKWLLFHVGKITRDLDVYSGMGYEYKELKEYKKYYGRLIVHFRNSSQNTIRMANTVLDDCEVYKILPEVFDDDVFPGYDNINISWKELSRVIEKKTWKTALENQKGVYLITDTKTGKRYVGSAYGEDMILGRWNAYVKSGHGGNKKLKKLDFEYIKKNFKYSILDIFKSTTDDDVIIQRESWWKETLMTRIEKFGYNDN